MQAPDQPALGWTVVLRRQPVRVVEGQPEGGYTDAYELICCECGDHPDLDYRDISPELQRVRGRYAFADGIAAYGESSLPGGFAKKRRPPFLKDAQPSLELFQHPASQPSPPPSS